MPRDVDDEHSRERGAAKREAPGLVRELSRLNRLLGKRLERNHANGERATPLVRLIVTPAEAIRLLGEMDASLGASSGTESAASTALLERLASAFELSRFDLDVLLLALSVELDERYTRIIAHLNDHPERGRPTVGLALDLLPVPAEERLGALARLLPDRPLREQRLLEVDGSGPLPAQVLRIPSDVWPRLAGFETAAPFPVHAPDPDLLATLALPGELRGEVEQLIAFGARAGPFVLLVKGPEGSGREALARAIASGLGRALLRVSAADLEATDGLPRLRRELAWHEAALLVDADLAPAAAGGLQALQAVRTPIFWLARDGAAEPFVRSLERPVLALEVREPALEQRTAIWDRLLPRAERDGAFDVAPIAASFHFGPGRISAAARVARARADLERGRGARITPAELETACREIPAARLGALAQRLGCPYTLEDLVVPAEVRRELGVAIAWARHGAHVFGEWGFEKKLASGRGLTCLFSGPPGTGKTMAAQVLSRALGLDLYRIDLSQVVNKYIGETEKNLARLFDEARAANVVLFFDEADALFGKRTEVKDAHDRHANVEVGYLLQRMEQHEGVSILATNLKHNLDEAFLRRLHVIAELPVPGPEERKRLWDKLLPDRAVRAPDLDIALLAERFTVTGGDIRNAALAASFLAAADGGTLGMRHAVRALWREMRKSGRLVAPAAFGPWQAVLAEPS